VTTVRSERAYFHCGDQLREMLASEIREVESRLGHQALALSIQRDFAGTRIQPRLPLVRMITRVPPQRMARIELRCWK